MRYKNRYETTCKNSQAARHPAFSFTTPFFAPVKLQKRSILEMAENTQPQLKRPGIIKLTYPTFQNSWSFFLLMGHHRRACTASLSYLLTRSLLSASIPPLVLAAQRRFLRVNCQTYLSAKPRKLRHLLCH